MSNCIKFQILGGKDKLLVLRVTTPDRYQGFRRIYWRRKP